MELLTKNAVKTFKSEDIISSKMGVSIETADLLAMYLRDKIYSDKILAPIREYICNAWDAHVESGNTDKFVEVKTIKFGSTYQWSVRDYGMGLDEDDVRNVFGIFGESTKRHSNKLVGTFGIGAMSGFSYTDTFYVTSWHNGVKTTYVCSLGAGEYGVEVGEIHKVSEEPTTETGLEVSFDVTKDFHTFNTKTLSFVQWFDPNAKIRYTSYQNNIITPIVPKVVRKSSLEGVTFSRYDNTSCSAYVRVRMGGVSYTDIWTNHTFNGYVVIDIPIGGMTIPISRESFEDNPSNNKYLEKLKGEIEKLYQDDISTLPRLTLTEYGENVSKSKIYNTEFFELNIIDAYPNHHEIWRSISLSESFSITKTEVLKTRAIVFCFPAIKSNKTWHRRLFSFLQKPGDDNPYYCHMLSCRYDSLKPIIDNIKSDVNVVFLNVKDMKLPKLVASKDEKKQYAVTQSGYNRTLYKTPEELEEYVAEKSPIDWDSLDVEFWNKQDLTKYDLHQRTIGKSNLPYGAWRCNSQKFLEMMVEIGWVEYLSPDYHAALAIIKKAEEEERKRQSVEYWLNGHILNKYWTAKTRSLIEKHYAKNSARMDKLLSRLQYNGATLKEKMRKLYIASIYAYSTPPLNRQEFRKLLNTKFD